MDSFCIYCIFILQNHSTLFYFYPKEIIMLIILMMYDNNKISCGPYCTTFTIGDDIYTSTHNLVPKKQTVTKDAIDSIHYGENYTLFIDKYKKAIYSWGSNERGQLGLGDYDDRTAPQKIMFDFKSRIILATYGHFNTFVVTVLGEIYGWGANYSGQLGLGDKMDRVIPHKLPIVDVKSVNCGGCYTMILTKRGELFSCGYNRYGQLGLGNFHDQPSLQKIIIPRTLFISCGENYTMALTATDLYSWGENTYGQLGLGNRTRQYAPQKNNLLSSLIISRIIAISCGLDYTMILTRYGELFVCGFNCAGQLGMGNVNHFHLVEFQKLSLNEVILSVDCGHYHTVVSTRSGKYYGWGQNDMGQLGLGDTKNRLEPTKIMI